MFLFLQALVLSASEPTCSGYRDWFELVTAPHYFAEILIYLGFLAVRGLACSYSLPLLFSFVCINLGYTAWRSHGWYRATFGAEYPPARRVLVPYLL